MADKIGEYILSWCHLQGGNYIIVCVGWGSYMPAYLGELLGAWQALDTPCEKRKKEKKNVEVLIAIGAHPKLKKTQLITYLLD